MNQDYYLNFQETINRLVKARLQYCFNKLFQKLNRSQTLDQLDLVYNEPSVLSMDENISILSYNVNKSQISQFTRKPQNQENNFQRLKRKSAQEDFIHQQQLLQQNNLLNLQIEKSSELTKLLTIDEKKQDYLQDDKSSIISQDKSSIMGQTTRRNLKLYNEKKQIKPLKKLQLNNNQTTATSDYKSELQDQLFDLIQGKKYDQNNDDALSFIDSTYTNNIDQEYRQLNRIKQNYQANDIQSRYQNQQLLQFEDALESPCNPFQQQNVFDQEIFSIENSTSGRKRVMSVYNQSFKKTKQSNEVNTVKMNPEKLNYFNFTHNKKKKQDDKKQKKSNQKFEVYFDEIFKIEEQKNKEDIKYEIIEDFVEIFNNIQSNCKKNYFQILKLNYRFHYQYKVMYISNNYLQKKKEEILQRLNKMKRYQEKINKKQLEISNCLLEKSQQLLNERLIEETMTAFKSILETIIKDRLFDYFFEILAQGQDDLSRSDLNSHYDLISKKNYLRASRNTFSQMLKQYNTQSNSQSQNNYSNNSTENNAVVFQKSNEKKKNNSNNFLQIKVSNEKKSNDKLINYMGKFHNILQMLENKTKKKIQSRRLKTLNSTGQHNLQLFSRQKIKPKFSLQANGFYSQSLLKIQLVQKQILHFSNIIKNLRLQKLQQSLTLIRKFKKNKQKKKITSLKKNNHRYINNIKKRYFLSKLRIKIQRRKKLVLKRLKHLINQQFFNNLIIENKIFFIIFFISRS